MIIPVKKIVITRAEGPINLCDKPHEFASFEDANKFLLRYYPTYPTMGYDKHDFHVEFT